MNEWQRSKLASLHSLSQPLTASHSGREVGLLLCHSVITSCWPPVAGTVAFPGAGFWLPSPPHPPLPCFPGGGHLSVAVEPLAASFIHGTPGVSIHGTPRAFIQSVTLLLALVCLDSAGPWRAGRVPGGLQWARRGGLAWRHGDSGKGPRRLPQSWVSASPSFARLGTQGPVQVSVCARSVPSALGFLSSCAPLLVAVRRKGLRTRPPLRGPVSVCAQSSLALLHSPPPSSSLSPSPPLSPPLSHTRADRKPQVCPLNLFFLLPLCPYPLHSSAGASRD